MTQNPDIPQLLRAASNLAQSGRLAEAERICLSIVSEKPNEANALRLLGMIAIQTGHADRGAELIGRAIALVPGSAGFHDDLGIAFGVLGRGDEGIAAHQKAIALDPRLFNARFNLGSALVAAGRLDEAIAAFRAALQINPTHADAHNSLGIAFLLSHKLDEAFEALNEAKRLRPNSAPIDMNLANAWLNCARPDEAMACLDRAIALEPAVAPRLSNRIFAMHYHPGYDAKAILNAAKQWNELVAAPLLSSIQPNQNDREPDRKLWIGYVSPDFRDHVVGRCMLAMLGHQDRSQFEIYCYANVGVEDATSAGLRQHCDAWRNIRRLSDERAAEMIRSDGIDILIDLAAHTQGNRLGIFARRPAPVQMTWLGCCTTTGLSAMDYRLSDPFSDPPQTDADYSEKTIRLPRTHLCYEPQAAAPEISPSPAGSNGVVTFGCLNNFTKCSSAAMGLWIEILQKTPGSRLILHPRAGKYLEAVRQKFESAGISRERLDFVDRGDWFEYMQTYARIDIALDPVPYNGAITSCDTLWMGVPIVTLSGKTAVGRMGPCILSNIGLPELIAQTPQEYVRLAVELAGNRERLNALRGELRSRMRNSPLMNARQLAQDLEAVYRQVWRDWCGA